MTKNPHTPKQHARFAAKLQGCLQALEALLARPGFGAGPATLGGELELFIMDERGAPAPINSEIIAEAQDSHLTYELGRFNLEYNLDHGPLAGRSLSRLTEEMESRLAQGRRIAANHRAKLVTVGILPTLTPENFADGTMTEVERYRAMATSLRDHRGAPFSVNITGEDPLELTCETVALEQANASFQVHLRVEPGRFSDTYNAVQLATAPLLAAAGNAPTFLGHRLWEETRIPLFKQAVDERPSGSRERKRGPARVTFGRGWLAGSAADFFRGFVEEHRTLFPRLDEEDPLDVARNGGIPQLTELRLHVGTVWQWNRPVYDPALGGHLRIEMRPLPSGPTPRDMAANAAFGVGLALGLEPHAARMTEALDFERARDNFYRAAREGLAATFYWPDESGKVKELSARELALRLLPLAEGGLQSAGVDPEEARACLEIIRRRVETGQTGAQWQRNFLTAYKGEEPFRALLGRYLELSLIGEPVHAWPETGKIS